MKNNAELIQSNWGFFVSRLEGLLWAAWLRLKKHVTLNSAAGFSLIKRN